MRQQVFGTLGRLSMNWKASGRLEALMRSGLRHCENFALIDAYAAGETHKLSPCSESGRTSSLAGSGKNAVLKEVIQSLLQARRYDFVVERAVHLTRVASAFCQRQRSSRSSVGSNGTKSRDRLTLGDYLADGPGGNDICALIL